MKSWCSTTAPGSPRAPRTRCAANPRSSRPIWGRRRMLEVDQLTAGYGNIQVLHRISLRVATGQSVCLIGANGVGKTTLLRSIAGLLRPSAGRIIVDGTDI